MKKILAFGLIVGAFVAHANVQRPGVKTEEIVWPIGHVNAMALSSSVQLGGRKFTGTGYVLTNISVRVPSGYASGGGAGNTVITATDGSNTCTFAIPCSVSQSSGVYTVAGANGSGTGCAYGGTAGVAASVTTAGCTTTQPSFNALLFLGKPL